MFTLFAVIIIYLLVNSKIHNRQPISLRTIYCVNQEAGLEGIGWHRTDLRRLKNQIKHISQTYCDMRLNLIDN